MQKTVLQKLVVQHFRSFTQKEIELDPSQTLILGNNGQGKTNILEAIALLSTGRSFRSSLLADAVQEGQEVAHLGIKAVIDGEEETIEAALVTASGSFSKASTRFMRNKVTKRRGDIVGLLKTVVFRPEDMELVIGPPSTKREFLDDVLVQVDPAYRVAKKEYDKAIQHRNKLILQLREGLVTRTDFLFWDTLLIRHGDLLSRQRSRFIHFINSFVPFPLESKVTYDSSLMTEERLHKYAIAEVGAGKTLVGPHRDNVLIAMRLRGEGMHDVERFGSRGQQRMAVLMLKIGALLFIEKETNQTPVLLLDDVFSELDDTNRELVFSLFSGRQVIMTSAEQVSSLPQECLQGLTLTLT